MKKCFKVLIVVLTLFIGGCTSMQSTILGYDVMPLEKLNTETAIIKTTDEMYGWETKEQVRQIWLLAIPKDLNGTSILPSIGIRKVSSRDGNKYFAELNLKGNRVYGIYTVENMIYRIDGKIFKLQLKNYDNFISTTNQFTPTEINQSIHVTKDFVERLSKAKNVKVRMNTTDGYLDYSNYSFEYSDNKGLAKYKKVYQDSLKVMLK